MKWLDNLRERHQEHVKEREADGKKGSVFFWYLVASLLLQIWRAWRGK